MVYSVITDYFAHNKFFFLYIVQETIILGCFGNFKCCCPDAEGQLIGETLKFPTTTEEVQALLKRIGVDGIRYEEYFITSFDGDVLGLYDCLYEYASLDELNHLACLLSELTPEEIATFEAVINKGDHTSSVAELINLTYNLDCYELLPGVDDDEALGIIYADELEAIKIPEELQGYFDYEAYGRDIRLNEGGHFAPGGYLHGSGSPFVKFYHGPEDIPPEHKVFAYPKLSIKERLTAYKEVSEKIAPEPMKPSPGQER